MIATLQDAKPETFAQIEKEMDLRRTRELFLLFSLGSQFDHLIAMALNRLGVFCLVGDPASVTVKVVADLAKKFELKGIILSGGPVSVYEDKTPLDHRILDLGIPVLGICLGLQLWAQHRGFEVTRGKQREFGTHTLTITATDSLLFADVPATTAVLESHGDVVILGEGMEVLGTTEHSSVAAAHCEHLWGVQFHPEVTETEYGDQILVNFCFAICGAKDRFPAENVAKRKIEEVRKTLGKNGKILLALSGGSDSSVVAYLLKAALGNKVSDRVRAVYIRGIDRPDDEAHVLKHFGWLNPVVIDTTDQFLNALRGVETMRDKRIAMRGVYKTVLEAEAKSFGATYIAQGTLYTDVCESGGGHQTGARKAKIKQHHNTMLNFNLPELTPLDDQIKDTARAIGRVIGVPEVLLTRHPFPGPGMLVRIEGEVTAEKLAIARQADGIFIEELHATGLYREVWQAGTVVTQSVTTCTKGDDAAFGVVVALWAVTSVNGFTARWAELPYEFLRRVSQRITNEIRSVGTVVYRVSDKPPTTIEWG